jgi:hypothetical protein
VMEKRKIKYRKNPSNVPVQGLLCCSCGSFLVLVDAEGGDEEPQRRYWKIDLSSVSILSRLEVVL